MKIARLLMVLTTLLMFAFATTGCDKGRKAAKEVEKMSEKACACKDKACAEATWKELKAVIEKHKKTRGDEEAQKRFATATGAAANCLIQQGISPQEVAEFLQSVAK